MDKKTLEEATFKVKRIGKIISNANSIAIDSERFDIQVGEAIIAILDIATQEDALLDYPTTWWDSFKIAKFPQWLLKRFPAQYNRAWVVRKYPEVNISPWGREYVNIKIVPWNKIDTLQLRLF